MAGTPSDLRFLMPEWFRWASCANPQTTFFDFPENKQELQKSKSVCHSCPVRLECLAYALCVGIEDGVWGGTNQEQRKLLRAFISIPIQDGEEAVLLILKQNMNGKPN